LAHAPSSTIRRHSRQRTRILEVLRSTTTHPSAAWLYGRLKKEIPRLSMGTVYRNLGILEEQGLVIRLDVGSASDRYDATVADHYHYVCERCDAVIDLPLPVDTSLAERVKAATGLAPRRHVLEFYGLCSGCAGEA
jgi:Fur family transcriptional regulator, peroxide stress response regulator